MEPRDEDYIEHKLDHCQQRYNWDCGVACVMMLLPATQREEMLDNFQELCQEEGFSQSTWTIDLCYLMKRFGIPHCMFTTTLGVNEHYRRHGYYDKIIQMDRSRISQRFAEAPLRGVRVRRHSLSHAELLAHLRTQGPAVLLVDATLLVCDLCKHNKLKAEFRRYFGGSYTGHYIVAVGCRRGKLLYRDPAHRARLCAAAPLALQRARAAPGTDQDAILVYKDYR